MRTAMRNVLTALSAVCVVVSMSYCSSDHASEHSAAKNAAVSQPPMDYWPTHGWRVSAPESQGVDSNKLIEMMQNVQARGADIDSISIARNGYLVMDAYFYPAKKESLHAIHSCTKSITSALVGIAIEKGYIKSVDQSVIELFPEKSFANMDASKRRMTVKHLLTMATGLDCRDSYKYNWAGLFEMMGSQDWVQHMLDLPMSDPPGEKYRYCNGASFLLSAIIQETTKMRTSDFAMQHLFAPLGITDVKWEANPQGIDYGWGGIWLKPHDMAKFGLLFLNKGRWDGAQIVPEAWVESSTHGDVKDGDIFDRYGFQWRVDNDGFYMAAGVGAQHIYVIPDKNMVAVFTADLGGSDFFIPHRLMEKYVLPAAKSSGPLPARPEKDAALSALIEEIAAPDPVVATTPTPPLPETALRISGERYVFPATNTVGLKAIMLTFQQRSSEAKIDFEWFDEGRDSSVSIGMDNVWRFTTLDDGGSWMGKGRWKSDSDFSYSYHHVGNTHKGSVTLKFKDDTVWMQIELSYGPKIAAIIGSRKLE